MSLKNLITSLIIFFLFFERSPSPSLQQVKAQNIEKLAQAITVRIFSTTKVSVRGGSGVLIKKNQYRYIVITNQHVVEDTELSYQIQTPDGLIYPVEIISNSTTDNDVALLAFESKKNSYPVLPLKSTSKLKENIVVYAGGFPFQADLKQSQELKITQGKIILILDKPFLGGYQIGYTNYVTNGMSGGPLLNQQGELIGLNGMPKAPLFGNPYVYKDGSTITEQEWDTMTHLSWAVPLKYILEITQY